MAVATSDGLRLSVAMAVYNGARYLAEQLDSIARQSRAPDELVISDNHSTDGTTKIVEAFASSAPFPVRLHVNEANLGISKNFEQAIRLCSGEVNSVAWMFNQQGVFSIEAGKRDPEE